jgi:hypothetical protein
MTIDHSGLVDRQTPAADAGTETGSHIGPLTRGRIESMGKPAKTILFVLLGTGVLCCGGGLIGAKVLADKVNDASISPEVYRAAQLGQPEDQVRKAVDKGSFARDSLFGQEPPIPASARCAYALSRRDDGDPTELVYRFCFADGKLVEKREIQTPGVDPTSK